MAKKLATVFDSSRDRNLFLSLLDQAVVSGTSFITTLLIGRICGAEELGIYSLAFTLIVLGTNLPQPSDSRFLDALYDLWEPAFG